MKIYFAGNFPLMGNPKKEKEMFDRVVSANNTYGRLITFFYPKYAQTILNIKQELRESKDEGKQTSITNNIKPHIRRLIKK